MKILINEQLPTKLKFRFKEFGFETETVRDMDWLGCKNGDLLKLMSDNHFDILVTNDKNLYYQQKIAILKVCILNINTKTNRYEDVLDKMDLIKNKLTEVQAHISITQGGYFIA